MNNIYTITAIEDEHSKVSRCVGWFDNYEDAKKNTLENARDFSECGGYKYAVIEKVGSGVFPFCNSEDQSWFKVVEETGAVGEIINIKDEGLKEIPEGFRGYSNFSIG